MQDERSMPSGSANGGRFFGGDRRVRPNPNQVLKCPRCDSLDTKFCYYNNYNLSQPRHFCKNCRRYWTIGGVLRNVPVGGGCRKAKRSKPKAASLSSDDRQKKRKLNDNSHSSSESSTLTTAPTTDPACSTSLPSLLSFSDSGLFIYQDSSNLPSFESPFSLDRSSENYGLFGYNFTETSPFRLNHQENELQQQDKMSMAEEMKILELTAGCDEDQTVGIDLSGLENGKADKGLTGLTWDSSQGLLDLSQGYWSQTEWTHPDQHIYLP